MVVMWLQQPVQCYWDMRRARAADQPAAVVDALTRVTRLQSRMGGVCLEDASTLTLVPWSLQGCTIALCRPCVWPPALTPRGFTPPRRTWVGLSWSTSEGVEWR